MSFLYLCQSLLLFLDGLHNIGDSFFIFKENTLLYFKEPFK